MKRSFLMNSNTNSILALIFRIGKTIGAILTIIGMMALFGTLGSLMNSGSNSSSSYSSALRDYSFSFNSMEHSGSQFGGSDREFLSGRVLDEASFSSSGSSAMAAANAVSGLTGSINAMCAGAFIMFFCSIGAFIFDLLTKKNVIGGFIDVCVGLMAFITNFIVAPTQTNLMSMAAKMAAGDVWGTISGWLAAFLLLVMAAFLMLRSAFPASSLSTKKNSGSGAVKKPVYQNPAYSQNPGYQNQPYQNGAQAPYQNGGYNGTPGGRM